MSPACSAAWWYARRLAAGRFALGRADPSQAALLGRSAALRGAGCRDQAGGSFVLFYDLARYPGTAAGYRSGLAGRDVVPPAGWRARPPACGFSRGGAAIAAFGALDLRGAWWRRSACSRPHRQFHQWQALGPGCAPIWPGRWCFRMAGRCRAIRASSAGLCGEGVLLLSCSPSRCGSAEAEAAASVTGVFGMGYAVACLRPNASASRIRSWASCSTRTGSPWACCSRCRCS